MSDTNTLRNAVIGAVVTIVLAFTAISPVVGGAVAGYLQQERPNRGARVGAISGVIASIPFLLVLALGVVVFFGTSTTGGFGAPGGVELAIILLLIVPLGVLWNAGLSAAGGYVGAYLRMKSGPAESTTPEFGQDAR
ncbi:hypothetical protein GJR96_15890 [Haloferax sp. MBLA0076]|uniref:Uncharacterized protein n=1 Tax=Haloferax litoreum TaxID=2666140 RepID=A0A6A8GJ87_9EURY|nr:MULTISPECIES: DUF5518 domain-containing protein [Haloferax]KAB1190459.1 hypothetical protein Hfx1148_15820 [Haloferax sp. CBA1148]MRX23434.1 hypothetical protein [Haloferax litoreum]